MSILRVLVAGLCCFSCSYVSIAQTCENIAVGYPTRVSSNQGGSLGGYATDGRMDTRWESQFSDPQWLVVDLGVAHTICEAVIRWEHASARDFSVDISSDSVTWTNVATISNNLEYVNRISITGSARYFRLNGTARTTGFGYSIYELEIHGIPPANCGETNLALNRPSTASSVGNPVYVKENAFDGDLATRWESAFSDPQFIAVDLGAVYSVCRIDLLWEDAYARDFQIQFSTDGTQWQTAASYIENASRRNSLSLSGSARYVRIFGTRRATNYGYSLYEVAIFGTSGALPAVFGTLTGAMFPAGSAWNGKFYRKRMSRNIVLNGGKIHPEYFVRSELLPAWETVRLKKPIILLTPIPPRVRISTGLKYWILINPTVCQRSYGCSSMRGREPCAISLKAGKLLFQNHLDCAGCNCSTVPVYCSKLCCNFRQRGLKFV